MGPSNNAVSTDARDHFAPLPLWQDNLSWKPISQFSSTAVSPLQQLVRVKISRDADDYPLTLRGLLLAQPHTKSCLRNAVKPSVSLTYGQLLDFMAPGGDGDLSVLGVQPGEVVVYVVPGGAIAAVAFLTIATQCTAAPLDPTTVKDDAADALEQFEAKHVIIFDGVPDQNIREAVEMANTAGQGIKMHKAVPKGDNEPGLFNLIPQTPDSTLERIKLDTTANDVVLLLRTSGTTSKPKGVPLEQGAIVRNGLLLSSTIEITKDDVCLNAMPLFHIGGLSASILATLATGGSITCIDAFTAEKFYNALGMAPQPTWYSSVPTIHMAVVNYIKDNLACVSAREHLPLDRLSSSQSSSIASNSSWKSSPPPPARPRGGSRSADGVGAADGVQRRGRRHAAGRILGWLPLRQRSAR
jgi:acyl-CoA synthetase (AMP-forming)/AMP-acid ligase II